MQGSSTKTVVAAIMAVVAGCALALGAAAHTTGDPTGVSLNAFTSGGANEYAFGAVTSPNAKCAPGRRVRVFRKRPGDDKLFGAESSIDGGVPGSATYTVTAETGNMGEGVYYSKLRRRDLKPGKRHTHLCRGARSGDLAVGP